MRTITQKTRTGIHFDGHKGVFNMLCTLATLVLAAIFTFSCSSSNTITKGTPVTDVDGQTYETVVIGTQTWMAKNLNRNIDTDTTVSVCYDNDTVNCTKYGRLYNWATAMALPSSCDTVKCTDQIQAKHKGICPAGWHIPNNADWDKLMRYIDGTSGTESPYDSETAGKYLKAKSGWEYQDGIENLDTYGFSALPGGYGSSNGSFSGAGYYGNWWSSSEYDSGIAYIQNMHYYYDDAVWDYRGKDYSHSVRCVQD